MEFASFVKGRKQYRVGTEGVNKVWNRGMGLIAFIRVRDGVVYINASFWRRTDGKLAAAVIDAVKRETGKKPTVLCVHLYYPNYYFLSLGKECESADAELSSRIKRDIAQAA
jgi:hypothetical protein